MTDLVPQQQHMPSFGARPQFGETVNQGAVAIEQERAIAEAQGKLILAKRFPRSMAAATADLMEACKSPEFAAQAFYAVPNRGSGPSIRFAEEVARVYGNFDYGHKEFSRSEGKSEIEVYAWDMEKNNYSKRQLTVVHVTDTKNGPKKLTDQTDIDNKIANVASKQMRGRILALVPKALVAMGIAACKLTIAGNNDVPISKRVGDMTAAFAKFGVNAVMLASYIGHTLDTTTVDELADLTGVFNAIKEGAKASDYFGDKEEKAAAISQVNAAATAGAGGAAKSTAKPEAKADAKKPAATAKPDQKADSKPAETKPEPAAADTPPVDEAPPDLTPPAGTAEDPLF